MLVRIPIVLWITVLMIVSTNVPASHPQQYQVVSGIAIYLTIIPAEMLRGHPKEHPESEMHSQTRVEDSNQHHIMVSLFNAKTGERLKNTLVKAKISGVNYEGPVRSLELMVLGGVQSYGNFFNMPLTGTYQVDLEIQQSGKTNTIKAVFQYASL